MHGWRSSCSPLHGWVLLLLLKQRINLILSFCEHFQFFKTLLRTHVTVRSNPRTVLKRSWLWRGDIVCCLSWNRCHSAWLQMWQLQYVFPRWWKCPPGTWISLRLHSVTKAVSLFFFFFSLLSCCSLLFILGNELQAAIAGCRWQRNEKYKDLLRWDGVSRKSNLSLKNKTAIVWLCCSADVHCSYPLCCRFATFLAPLPSWGLPCQN